VSKVDSSSPEAIRDAIHAVLAEPGLHRHGEKVLNRLFNAPGHQMTRKALCHEFHPGLLSLWFGTLCKAVAKELGDPDPVRPYALTCTVPMAEGEALRLKSSIVKAMGG
jgi:hypothetical protein